MFNSKSIWKAISTGFGAMCIFVGIIMMGGAANDCDGHCMEYANTLPEMLMIAGIGLMLMISGVFFILVGQSK